MDRDTHVDRSRQKRKKKKLVPQDNKLQISAKKNVNFFVFISKIFLKHFEEIELHALGMAISKCVILAEKIERFGLGKMTSIRTFEFQTERREGDRRPPMKKVKMIIIVKRD
jgi:DNA-binding protein